MGYKIVNTLLANQDLDGIVSYIADDLENPAAAANFLDELDECLGRLDELDECLGRLEKMPLMYEQCQDVRLKGLGYRKARVGNYLMIYRVDESVKCVYILRFFYARRDYEKLI